uniref:Cytochrome P450 n=1 Tax=Arion vulgaris TaxID=1028688 RepID=A0A0B7ATN8_9EUPU
MAFMRAFGRIVEINKLPPRNVYSAQSVLLSTAAPGVHIGNVPNSKPFEDIPGPKGIYTWPVIGTMLHFKPFTDIVAETSHRLINQMFEKYGPIVKLRFGETLVMVCDPKDMETVFRNEGKYPVRFNVSISTAFLRRNKIKPTVVDLTGEDWHSIRTQLNKRLMKVDSAHAYLQPQNAVADEFVNKLATYDLSAESLAELFFRYAVESIGVVCFNTRLGYFDREAMQNPEKVAFLKASKDVFMYIHKSLSGDSLVHNWYKNKVYRGYEQSRLTVRENTIKHIQEARHVLESQKKDRTFDAEEPNLLFSLLSDTTLDNDDVVGTLEGLYVAGTDSTAKNLLSFFYNLAKNPESQEKLRTEIRNVLGHDQPVTAESLAKMHYLKACLKESFRYSYPTVSGTRRILPTDVVLSGYRVPAGTIISMHNPKACRDYFSNANKFLPERWLRSSDGSHKEEIPKMASLPFGHGPKNCLGRRFAEQEIYLAVTKVVQKLKIEVEPESSNTNFIYTLFIQPEKPIKFKFTKLDD